MAADHSPAAPSSSSPSAAAPASAAAASSSSTSGLPNTMGKASPVKPPRDPYAVDVFKSPTLPAGRSSGGPEIPPGGAVPPPSGVGVGGSHSDPASPANSFACLPPAPPPTASSTPGDTSAGGVGSPGTASFTDGGSFGPGRAPPAAAPAPPLAPPIATPPSPAPATSAPAGSIATEDAAGVTTTPPPVAAPPAPFSTVDYVRTTFGGLKVAVEREVFRRGWMTLPDAASLHMALVPLANTLFDNSIKELSYEGLQRHVDEVLLTQLRTYVSEPAVDPAVLPPWRRTPMDAHADSKASSPFHTWLHAKLVLDPSFDTRYRYQAILDPNYLRMVAESTVNPAPQGSRDDRGGAESGAGGGLSANADMSSTTEQHMLLAAGSAAAALIHPGHHTHGGVIGGGQAAQQALQQHGLSHGGGPYPPGGTPLPRGPLSGVPMGGLPGPSSSSNMPSAAGTSTAGGGGRLPTNFGGLPTISHGGGASGSRGGSAVGPFGDAGGYPHGGDAMGNMAQILAYQSATAGNALTMPFAAMPSGLAMQGGLPGASQPKAHNYGAMPSGHSPGSQLGSTSGGGGQSGGNNVPQSDFTGAATSNASIAHLLTGGRPNAASMTPPPQHNLGLSGMDPATYHAMIGAAQAAAGGNSAANPYPRTGGGMGSQPPGSFSVGGQQLGSNTGGGPASATSVHQPHLGHAPQHLHSASMGHMHGAAQSGGGHHHLGTGGNAATATPPPMSAAFSNAELHATMPPSAAGGQAGGHPMGAQPGPKYHAAAAAGGLPMGANTSAASAFSAPNAGMGHPHPHHQLGGLPQPSSGAAGGGAVSPGPPLPISEQLAKMLHSNGVNKDTFMNILQQAWPGGAQLSPEVIVRCLQEARANGGVAGGANLYSAGAHAPGGNTPHPQGSPAPPPGVMAGGLPTASVAPKPPAGGLPMPSSGSAAPGGLPGLPASGMGSQVSSANITTPLSATTSKPSVSKLMSAYEDDDDQADNHDTSAWSDGEHIQVPLPPSSSRAPAAGGAPSHPPTSGAHRGGESRRQQWEAFLGKHRLTDLLSFLADFDVLELALLTWAEFDEKVVRKICSQSKRLALHKALQEVAATHEQMQQNHHKQQQQQARQQRAAPQPIPGGLLSGTSGPASVTPASRAQAQSKSNQQLSPSNTGPNATASALPLPKTAAAAAGGLPSGNLAAPMTALPRSQQLQLQAAAATSNALPPQPRHASAITSMVRAMTGAPIPSPSGPSPQASPPAAARGTAHAARPARGGRSIPSAGASAPYALGDSEYTADEEGYGYPGGGHAAAHQPPLQPPHVYGNAYDGHHPPSGGGARQQPPTGSDHHYASHPPPHHHSTQQQPAHYEDADGYDIGEVGGAQGRSRRGGGARGGGHRGASDDGGVTRSGHAHHGASAAFGGDPRVCRFFGMPGGGCKNGADCKYAHIHPSDHNAASEAIPAPRHAASRAPHHATGNSTAERSPSDDANRTHEQQAPATEYGMSPGRGSARRTTGSTFRGGGSRR